MADEPLKLDLHDALNTVSGLDRPFDVLFEKGGFLLEFYAPTGADLQQAHDRDEFYIVARGTAAFRRGEDVVDVEAGDAVFAPAWAEHRFERFSDNFATWVVFFGPVVAKS